jgi:hypothetical protein
LYAHFPQKAGKDGNPALESEATGSTKIFIKFLRKGTFLVLVS